MTDFLRQPIEKIRELQNKLVAEQIALCAQGHEFYKQRWAEHGVDPATVKTIDDLERLPLTSKKDLMDSPEAFRLQCPDLPLAQRTLWEANYTTGPTSDARPLDVATPDDVT